MGNFCNKFVRSIIVGFILIMSLDSFADVELHDEAAEKDYQENIKGFLLSLDIKECSDAIKSKGFRPLILHDDLVELQASWDIEEIPLSKMDPKTNYNTLVSSTQSITHVITMRKKLLANNVEKKGVEPDFKIIILYRQNQREAFMEIFKKITNTSLPLEFAIADYHVSDKLSLGDLCLFEYLFVNRQSTNIKNGIYFVKDSIQFSIISPTEEVTPIAQYIEKRYTELTAELNSAPVFRKWFAPDKIFSVEAKYVSSDSTKVKLIGKDDKQIEIELSKLSPVDILYVKRRVEVEDVKSKITVPQKTDKPTPKTK